VTDGWLAVVVVVVELTAGRRRRRRLVVVVEVLEVGVMVGPGLGVVTVVLVIT